MKHGRMILDVVNAVVDVVGGGLVLGLDELPDSPDSSLSWM